MTAVTATKASPGPSGASQPAGTSGDTAFALILAVAGNVAQSQPQAPVLPGSSSKAGVVSTGAAAIAGTSGATTLVGAPGDNAATALSRSDAAVASGWAQGISGPMASATGSPASSSAAPPATNGRTGDGHAGPDLADAGRPVPAVASGSAQEISGAMTSATGSLASSSAARLATYGHAADGSGAVDPAAAGRPAAAVTTASPVPVSQVPVSQVPVSQVPVSQVPAAQVPAAQVPAAQVPVSRVPAARAPVAQVAAAPVAAAAVAAAYKPAPPGTAGQSASGLPGAGSGASGEIDNGSPAPVAGVAVTPRAQLAANGSAAPAGSPSSVANGQSALAALIAPATDDAAAAVTVGRGQASPTGPTPGHTGGPEGVPSRFATPASTGSPGNGASPSQDQGSPRAGAGGPQTGAGKLTGVDASRDPDGPTPGGPSTGGPSTGGPNMGGPSTGGPSTGGPSTGGPSTGGPSTGGPSTGGPNVGGPNMGGPSRGGPHPEGAAPGLIGSRLTAPGEPAVAVGGPELTKRAAASALTGTSIDATGRPVPLGTETSSMSSQAGATNNPSALSGVGPPSMTAPAGAPTSTAISSPSDTALSSERLRPEAVATQLATVLSQSARQPDGSYQVNIRLQPEELGVVQVELRLVAGTVNVSLHAEGDATGDMLRQNLPQLRQQLASTGLTTGQFDVSSGTTSGQEGSAGGRGPERNLINDAGANGSEAAPIGARATVPTISPTPNGQLDMRL